MQSKHECILRSVNNTNKSFNILTFSTHERFQSNLATLQHTFCLFQGQNIKPWYEKYAILPKNHIMLNGQKDQIKQDMKFDIILSQNKFGQYEVAKSIADQLNIPLISLEHTLPFVEWKPEQTRQVNDMRGDLNLFISEYSMKAWGSSFNDPTVRILHHGIDTDRFKPNPNIESEEWLFACCNDLKNRNWACGYDQWKEVVDGLPNKILGDNPGVSKPAKSIDDLVEHYNRCSAFVSTTILSPIPTVVLEAMSCGKPVLVLDNCMLPEIVKDGFNGWISSDIKYLKEKAKLMLKNKDLAKEIGFNARKTILEKFSLQKHLENWNKLLDEAYGSCHK